MMPDTMDGSKPAPVGLAVQYQSWGAPKSRRGGQAVPGVGDGQPRRPATPKSGGRRPQYFAGHKRFQCYGEPAGAACHFVKHVDSHHPGTLHRENCLWILYIPFLLGRTHWRGSAAHWLRGLAVLNAGRSVIRDRTVHGWNCGGVRGPVGARSQVGRWFEGLTSGGRPIRDFRQSGQTHC